MKIGIMGAMPQEIDSILAHMNDVVTIDHGGRQYHTGKINVHDVVLVFSGWGKVAAASTATTLIEKFGIEQLIFTGVAGASSPDLNIGDIVISSQLYQHDMKSKFFPDGEIPLTGITLFQADSALIARAHRAGSALFSTSSRARILEELKTLGITDPNPKCVIGTIATGDQFIDNAEQRAAIMKQWPNTLAFEMEGGAIAQVCHSRIPFVVARTISDGADHLAADNFQVFIEKVARYYSEHIVTSMLADQDDDVIDAEARYGLVCN